MNKTIKLLILLLTTQLYSQQDVDLYGEWISYIDKERLTINEDNTFIRVNKDSISRGEFEIKNNKICVTKSSDAYKLIFTIKNTTLYVYKPHSKKCWMFEKLSN